jgi:beta-aspartyl-peptidase (threonine type)
MQNQQKGWAIIVHGGAKEIAPDKEQANRDGCLRAVDAGRAVLEGGGSAVDAVEAAIRVLEDDATFNAGYGSDVNTDGVVQMDAAIMDGSNFDLGAVAAIEGVRHPISVAKRLLREPPVLLASDGARRFAAEHKLELCAAEALIAPDKSGAHEHDTVGCVALDRHGHIAAGTSTGGLEETLPGRVGDSPMPGCGLYADDELGGVSLSGDGETIARMALAMRIMHGFGEQEPEEAIEAALRRLERIDGEAGAIVIDAHGRIGWMHNSEHFAVAMMRDGMGEPAVWLTKEEERSANG